MVEVGPRSNRQWIGALDILLKREKTSIQASRCYHNWRVSMNIILPVSRRRYAMIALAVHLTAPALAAAPELPPLNDPPTHARLPGKFVWVDLLTPDVERAETFYGKLFGWSFRQTGDYTLAFLGEEPMAGMLRVAAKAGESRSARWVGYVSVPDVSAAQR